MHFLTRASACLRMCVFCVSAYLRAFVCVRPPRLPHLVSDLLNTFCPRRRRRHRTFIITHTRRWATAAAAFSHTEKRWRINLRQVRRRERKLTAKSAAPAGCCGAAAAARGRDSAVYSTRTYAPTKKSRRGGAVSAGSSADRLFPAKSN